MDRQRTESPIYARQWSSESGVTSAGAVVASPSRFQYHHSRTSSAGAGISSVKRTQNIAAKAAAQRLSQVMASQTADDDDEEDGGDLGFRYSAPPPISLSRNSLAANAGKASGGGAVIVARSPSPAMVRNASEDIPSNRSTSAERPSLSLWTTPLVRLQTRYPLGMLYHDHQSILHQIDNEKRVFLKYIMVGHCRVLSDIGNFTSKNIDQHDASALRDELRLEEGKCQEAEARAKELKKQVASLGEGVYPLKQNL